MKLFSNQITSSGQLNNFFLTPEKKDRISMKILMKLFPENYIFVRLRWATKIVWVVVTATEKWKRDFISWLSAFIFHFFVKTELTYTDQRNVLLFELFIFHPTKTTKNHKHIPKLLYLLLDLEISLWESLDQALPWK